MRLQEVRRRFRRSLGFFAGFTGKFIVEETMNMGSPFAAPFGLTTSPYCAYINDRENEYGVLNPGAPITPQNEQELYKIRTPPAT